MGASGTVSLTVLDNESVLHGWVHDPFPGFELESMLHRWLHDPSSAFGRCLSNDSSDTVSIPQSGILG